MVKPKAVIFDYYETLVALAHEPRERAFDALARRVGVALPPGEAYRQWRELTTKESVLRYGSDERPPLDGDAPPFRTFEDIWRERSVQLFRLWGVDTDAQAGADAYVEAHAAAQLYPEVAATVEALRERMPVAVLSDADDSFLLESLRRNGLAIETVVSSEGVRTYKPHVSIFRETCARLGVAPDEAVYVGDSPWADIAGARNAGLGAVWLNRHGRDWPDDISPLPEHTVTALDGLSPLLVR